MNIYCKVSGSDDHWVIQKLQTGRHMVSIIQDLYPHKNILASIQPQGLYIPMNKNIHSVTYRITLKNCFPIFREPHKWHTLLCSVLACVPNHTSLHFTRYQNIKQTSVLSSLGDRRKTGSSCHCKLNSYFF